MRVLKSLRERRGSGSAKWRSSSPQSGALRKLERETVILLHSEENARVQLLPRNGQEGLADQTAVGQLLCSFDRVRLPANMLDNRDEELGGRVGCGILRCGEEIS